MMNCVLFAISGLRDSTASDSAAALDPRPSLHDDAHEDHSRQPTRFLCRREHGHRDPRAGNQAVRPANLRLSRDRPQQARRRAVSGPGRRVRRGARRGARGRPPALLGAWRFARGAPSSRRAAAEDDRRHLPAGHQGPPGSDALCPRRLHHRAGRPRRARRGDRHDGRGAPRHVPGRIARGRRSPASLDRQAGLPYADDPLGRRRQPDHQPAESPLSAYRRPAQGRYLLRHAEPPGSGTAAGRPGRPGVGAGQPEQLEQPASGRAGRRGRGAGAPDRWTGRYRPGLVRRR